MAFSWHYWPPPEHMVPNKIKVYSNAVLQLFKEHNQSPHKLRSNYTWKEPP